MAMNVNDERNGVSFVEVMKKFLDGMDLTVIIFSWMSPYSIQIIA